MNLDVCVCVCGWCAKRIDGVGSDSSCSSGWKKIWREWIGGNLLLDIYIIHTYVVGMDHGERLRQTNLLLSCMHTYIWTICRDK